MTFLQLCGKARQGKARQGKLGEARHGGRFVLERGGHEEQRGRTGMKPGVKPSLMRWGASLRQSYQMVETL